MKYRLLIRFLSLLTFVIFLCPFFQMCSDEDMMKKTHREVIAITEDMSAKEVDSIHAKERQEFSAERAKVIEQSRKEYTYNGYQLSLHLLANMDGGELKLSDIKDPSLYAFICYILMLLTSVIVAVYSFTSNYKKTMLFGTVSFFVVLIPLVIFYSIELLEDINQIRYGYYLFIINVIAIILLAQKARSKVLTHAI